MRLILLFAITAGAAAEDALQVTDEVLAGGPDRFLEARHLVLRGPNEAIGKKLAEVARERHGARPADPADPLLLQVATRWFERSWPEHAARARGAGSLWLPYHSGSLFGCSVVFYPPGATADGKGVLSRNLDFTTGTIAGRRAGPGDPTAMSRPYVIEAWPDRGHPSLYLACFDLLGGALDGINSEGLAVALLADDELMDTGRMEPSRAMQVGLNELQLVRYLLDTCADVPQAKAALLAARTYYLYLPCHYVVADRQGRASSSR